MRRLKVAGSFLLLLVLVLGTLLVASPIVSAGGLGVFVPYTSCSDGWCPKCPPAPEFSKCEAKCPDGFILVEEYSNVAETGLVVCRKKDDPRLLPLRCYYFNDKCLDLRIDNSTSGVDVYATIFSVINSNINQMNNATLSVFLADIATMSPRVYSSVEKWKADASQDIEVKRGETFGGWEEKKLKDEDTMVAKAYWAFIYGVYNSLVKTARSLSLLFLLVFTAWFFGSYSFLSWVYSAFERGNFPYHSIATYLVRAGIVVSVFFLPLPDGKLKNEQVFQPAFIKAVRVVAELGNAMADKVSEKIGNEYVDFVLAAAKDVEARTILARKTMLEATFESLKGREKEILRNCYRVYDAGTFDVSEETLERAVDFFDNATGEATVWSPATCREKEHSFISDAMAYNRGYLSLVSTVGENALEDTFFTKHQTDWALATRSYAEISKKVGWLAFPIVAVMGVNSVIAGQIETMGGVMLADMGGLKVKALKENESWFQKKLGKYYRGILSFVGRFFVIASLPPGQQVMSGVTKAITKLGKFGGSIVGMLVGGGAGGIVGTVLGKFAGQTIGTAVSLSAGLVFAYVVTIFMMKMMMLFAVVLGFLFRYLAYFVELVKVTFVAPFVAAWSLTLRRYEQATVFTGKVLHLLVYPTMILVGVFMAVALQGITSIVLYRLPCTAVDIIQSNAITGAGCGVVRPFLSYIIKGFFWWLAYVASMIVGFLAAFQGPEWLLEAFGRWEGAWQSATHAARQVGERVAARFISPV